MPGPRAGHVAWLLPPPTNTSCHQLLPCFPLTASLAYLQRTTLVQVPAEALLQQAAAGYCFRYRGITQGREGDCEMGAGSEVCPPGAPRATGRGVELPSTQLGPLARSSSCTKANKVRGTYYASTLPCVEIQLTATNPNSDVESKGPRDLLYGVVTVASNQQSGMPKLCLAGCFHSC